MNQLKSAQFPEEAALTRPKCSYEQVPSGARFGPNCEEPIARPPVNDFGAYVADRTRDFTGREWVFKALDDWLADPKGSQFFILTGEPGVGKSAIAARLTQIREPAAYHFCIAGQADTTDPLKFARSISQQRCRFDGLAR